MPDTPSIIVLAKTNADAGDRIVDMEKNFMSTPFILPAILLCYEAYPQIFCSSVRYHTQLIHLKTRSFKNGIRPKARTNMCASYQHGVGVRHRYDVLELAEDCHS